MTWWARWSWSWWWSGASSFSPRSSFSSLSSSSRPFLLLFSWQPQTNLFITFFATSSHLRQSWNISEKTTFCLRPWNHFWRKGILRLFSSFHSSELFFGNVTGEFRLRPVFLKTCSCKDFLQSQNYHNVHHNDPNFRQNVDEYQPDYSVGNPKGFDSLEKKFFLIKFGKFVASTCRLGTHGS